MMPSLGADMEFGTVLEWLVKPGDAVKRGDIVAVVDTEKATIEVEIFETGVVQKILVSEGEKVPVGTLLAVLTTNGEAAAPTETQPKAVTAPQPKPAPPAPSAPASVAPRLATRPTPAPAASHRLHISPLAMRVALDLKVDIATLTGTGPGGAITKADVERAAKAAHAPAPATSTEPAAPDLVVTAKPARAPIDHRAAMRKVIAAAMARSKREIPHYYLGTQIDMGRALAWLQAENLKRPVTERLLYSVLLLKAVALAIHEVPEMNGLWVDGAFRRSDAAHVGVAISIRGGGLIAPAIHNVEKKSLAEIMVNLRDLVQRARAGVLRSSEIADATITVTNLGEQGVETVFGVIYPPQVALVGFGKIVERPWASGGMIGARPVVSASLSGDHRASDGHRGGLFLTAIERLLQEPLKL
ncbi:MAG: 2-oxo acid dehydrogenase subunit E2 [Deltaproteobacteria bacterium]|nr:2-oxo acid dehydrogenase subunit E2 [Deltaproteobacteria bacterium]